MRPKLSWSMIALVLACVATCPHPALAAAPPVAGPLTAAGATGLAARHAQGQTFLTWSVPVGTGWRYRIYRSPSPIVTEADLASATLHAELADSSALDRRLSRLSGQLFGYVVRESPLEELQPHQGLCVVTPVSAGLAYYAVTAQPPAQPEDRTLVPGDNTLTTPVVETLDVPAPLRQREVSFGGRTIAVYTLFVSHVDTPSFPAMANRPGMAFDCGIVQTAGPGPRLMLLKPHARGGHFLDSSAGTNTPGEYVLALDDPLPNGENTFWFGYHAAYDITRRDGLPPLSGVVVDYTFRRVKHTIDWAIATFTIDPTRVYAFGYSMGAIGSVEFALWMPERIAAVMAVLGKFDFSFLTEPDPTAWFNPGHQMRQTVDQMWGTVATGLSTVDGHGVYQRLNMGWIVAQAGVRDVPPLFALNAKRDNVVGWAEKLPFYAAMRLQRHGGAFFWDTNDHYGLTIPRYWQPMIDPTYLYRFRSNRSYPAFTNCSLDDDPGTGTFASGDTIGTINAFLEWDPEPDEESDRWQAMLRMRSLHAHGGVTYAPPDSCFADVTPNRLQLLDFAPGTSVEFTVRRLSDHALLQSGMAPVDALGRPTASQVRIQKNGVIIEFGRQTLGVGAPPVVPGVRLALASNPARGSLRLTATWAADRAGRVDLYDIAGRLVQPIYSGPRPPVAELSVDTGALAPGLYLVSASSGGEGITERVVVIR